MCKKYTENYKTLLKGTEEYINGKTFHILSIGKFNTVKTAIFPKLTEIQHKPSENSISLILQK